MKWTKIPDSIKSFSRYGNDDNGDSDDNNDSNNVKNKEDYKDNHKDDHKDNYKVLWSKPDSASDIFNEF